MKKKSVFSILLLSSLLFGCSNTSASVSNRPSGSQNSTVSDKGSASSKPGSVTSNRPSDSVSSGSSTTPSTTPSVSTPESPSTPSTSPSTPSVTPSVTPEPDPEPDPSVVTSIKITHKTFNLKVEESAKVEVVCFPLTATAEYSFSSSNDEVCTVDSEGNLLAVSSGTAIITASTTDGKFSDTCTVNVTGEHLAGVSLVLPSDALVRNSSEYTLQVGSSSKFSVAVDPEDSVVKSIEYSVEKDYGEVSEYATIDPDGTFHALQVGSVKVKVTVKSTLNTFNDSVSIYIASTPNYVKTLLQNKASASYDLEKDEVKDGTYSFRKKASAYSDYTETASFHIYDNDSTISSIKKIDNTQTTDNEDNYVTYDGIENGKYYHLKRNTADNSYDYAEAKTVKTGDVEGDIEENDAKKQSSVVSYNSYYGAGNILESKVLSDSSFLGGTGTWNDGITFSYVSDKVEFKGNYIKESGYGWYKVQNYVDVSISVEFASDGMIKAFTATSNVYDSTGYDFTNKKLLDDATAKEVYEYSLSQSTGERKAPEESEKLIQPSECYFTSYTLKARTGYSGPYGNDFKYMDTINIEVDDIQPKTATTQIDPIVVTESSDSSVIPVPKNSLQVSAKGVGSTTLKTKSSSGIEKSISLDVSYAETTEITLKSKSSYGSFYSYTDSALKVGNSVELKAEVNVGANPAYTLSLDEKYKDYATLVKDETSGTYKLTGVKAGGIKIKAESSGLTLEKELWIVGDDIASEDVPGALNGASFTYTDYSKNTYKFVFGETTGTLYYKKSTETEYSSVGTFSYTLNGFDIVTSDLEGITSFSTFALQKNGVSLYASFKTSIGSVYANYGSSCFTKVVD